MNILLNICFRVPQKTVIQSVNDLFTPVNRRMNTEQTSCLSGNLDHEEVKLYGQFWLTAARHFDQTANVTSERSFPQRAKLQTLGHEVAL